MESKFVDKHFKHGFGIRTNNNINKAVKRFWIKLTEVKK